MSDRFQLGLAILGAAVFVAVMVWVMSVADSRIEAQAAAAAKWRWEHITGPQMDQCRKLGGVPILSSWDGQLKRCDFPAAVRP